MYNKESVKILSIKITTEELKEIENSKKVGAGKCADLYKKNEEVYKLIKQDAKRLYSKTIESLIGIKNRTCVFPNDLLVDENNQLIGYTMDYVQGTKLKDIFSQIPFEQMKEIINQAELGITEISENKILFDDFHFENMMWDSEEKCIKIIDTDFFKKDEDISSIGATKSNISKFNENMETVIGLDDYILKKYLSQNKEYKDFYKEWKNRYANGEQLNIYELIEKIKSIAETDFDMKFNSISEIIEKAKGRVKEYEDEELDIESWAEGNEHLKNLLTSCRDNEVPSMYSCAGHGKGKPAYITVEMNTKTITKIYNIISRISEIKDISLRFAQKEFGKNPNFTIYMNNEKNKNEIMDIISKSMVQEKTKQELPNNFKILTDIVDIFQNENMGFDLVYDIGKKRNNLLLENFKFANSKYMDDNDFKEIGFKTKKDIFSNKKYIRNGIVQGTKEQNVLGDIFNYLATIYDKDVELVERPKKEKWINKFIKKIPLLNKLIKKGTTMLPEVVMQEHNNPINEQREEFLNIISNNGEYRKMAHRKIEQDKSKNTNSVKSKDNNGDLIL